MTLAELKKGEERVIAEVKGDPTLKFRLEELGFVPGSRVRTVSRGPFRDPIAFRVRGTTIALRKREAQCIQV